MADKDFKVKNGLEVGDHISLPDNKQIQLGDGNDGTIHHDGSHFRLRAGTGNFNIQTNDFHITDASNTHARFVVDHDGETRLFHNGTAKLTTDAQGVNVIGGLDVTNITSTGTINMNHDGATLFFGADVDMRIKHDGSNGTIQCDTGILNVTNNDIRFKTSGAETMLRAVANGAVEIMYDNVTKLTTSSAGGALTGIWSGNSITQGVSSNNTAFATTEFVTRAVNNLIDGAPSTLDTLNEIAAAVNDDANYVGTVNTALALKAPKSSPAFTGNATFGGNVSVTKTSGWAELHLDGASGGDFILKDNGVNIGEIYAGVGHGMVLKSYSSQDMFFLTNANATAKMTIKSGGNVGIGTDSPNAFLSVRKDNNNSGNQFIVADTEGVSAAVRTYTHGGDDSGLILNHYYAVAGSGNEYMRYADFVANVGNGAGTTMRFITKNAANAYSTTVIDNNGQVGIGTNNPNSYTGETTLTINGTSFGRLDLEAGGTLRSSLFSGSTYTALVVGTSRIQIESSSDIKFNTGNQTKMIVKANGDVGVGQTPSATSSYMVALQVGEQTNLYGHTDGTGAGSSTYLSNNITHNGGFKYINADSGSQYTQASGTHSWSRFASGSAGAAATEITVMRIDSNGNVGIGDLSPDNKLSIRAASTIGTKNGHIMLTGDSATNGQGPQIVFSESGNSSDFAGASVGYARTGGNGVGDLIFGTRATSGDANTIPTERLRIFSTGLSTFTGPASQVNLGGGSTGSAALYVNSTSGHTGEMLQLLKNGSNRLTLLNNGNATFAGKITVETTDSQFYRRLFVKDGTHGLYMGQWDGSNHRIEADSYRPLTIQAYHSGGITLGISGNTKLLVTNADVRVTGKFEASGEIESPTFFSSVATGGGVYQRITHQGNETWTWAAQSGSGSDDYLDVGINGGTRTMSWHENGYVGIGTTAPTEKLHVTGQLISTGSNSTSATAGVERAIMDLSAFSATDHSARFGHFRGTNSAGAGQLRLYTDSVERVRIDQDGQVGIGTNNPLSRLQIGNFTSSTEELTIAVSQNGTGKLFFTDNNNSEGGYIKNTGTTYGSDFVFGGTWNSDLDSVAIRVRQNSSSGAASQWKAKMGIGTTAPIAGLEVRGFNENKDNTDADYATGAEEPILMLRGANGASVSEWVHSSKAVAAGQGTQTPMISWYRFDMPGGWSGTGTPGFLEIHNQISGMHASGSACEKFYLSLPNEHGNIGTAGGLQNTSISRYYSYTANVGAYTTSISTVFYYGNSSSFGYAAGAIFMKVTHASREPFFTMYAKYIGGTGSSRNYPQKMHFMGTEVTNNHQPSNISSLSVHDGRGML